jgi:Mlc titration factor MtfA (ptsG expression regulator)
MTIWETLKEYFIRSVQAEYSFKSEWLPMLEANLPLYHKLPESLQQRLHQKIGQFIATTYFEACGDLELTEEMILTVAGQACLLVVNHEGAPYPRLNSVLLYPSTFRSVVQDTGSFGITTERTVSRLGESWSNGTVVLAWDSVQHGARNIHDGHNVTLHEFAHQLDSENGSTDGVPRLADREAFQTWATVLGPCYEALVDHAERGRKTVLDHYGATNITEYFAVATEAFFEKPRQLKKKRPALYTELQSYYQLDPLEWLQLKRSAAND